MTTHKNISSDLIFSSSLDLWISEKSELENCRGAAARLILGSPVIDQIIKLEREQGREIIFVRMSDAALGIPLLGISTEHLTLERARDLGFNDSEANLLALAGNFLGLENAVNLPLLMGDRDLSSTVYDAFNVAFGNESYWPEEF